MKKNSLVRIGFMVLAAGALVSCGKSSEKSGSGGAGVHIFQDNEAAPSIYYHPIYNTLDQSDASLQTLVDENGNTLIKLTDEQQKNCALQGSCSFISADGKSMRHFGVKARINDVVRFYERRTDRCPYGIGSYGYCVDPFFSVGADGQYFKLGDVLYFPKLKDLALPTGEIHDGYMIVRDNRRAGAHSFVFYTGFYNLQNAQNTFARMGLGYLGNIVEFQRVTDPDVIARVKSQHGYPFLTQQAYDRGMAEIKSHLQQ